MSSLVSTLVVRTCLPRMTQSELFAVMIGGMAPSRRPEIARFGHKTGAAASLPNFMSAAIAGFFLPMVL